MRICKFILGYLLFASCCFFVVSCDQINAPQQSAEADRNYVPLVVAGDFAPGELEAHYKKHGIEFGIITQQEYLDAARVLLNAAQGRDVLQKKRTNGDILRYRVSTREFAVMTAKGRIRTYFKADYNYWMRQ